MEFTERNRRFYEATLKHNKIERILCAAIWYRDLELKVDIPDNRNPYNINEGAVICGHRHPHCMWTMCALTGLSSPECGRNIQGFLTNCNRFVTRTEAAEIGWIAGQLRDKPYRDGEWLEVYSEDFY